MAKQKKLPAMQFYTGDWMKDTNLRGVSLAAKGLWIDMLCLMHESDRRGYLQNNGKPISQDQLARMTGCSSEEVSQCLEELENSGVFSRTKNRIIYSRRMKRDEEIRQKSIINGKLGGNPALKAGVNPPLNRKQGSSFSASTVSFSPRDPPEISPELLAAAEGISLMPGTQVNALLRLYPAEWVKEAIDVAAMRNTRDWTYIGGILRNWQKKGGPDHDHQLRPSGRAHHVGAKRKELADRYAD